MTYALHLTKPNMVHNAVEPDVTINRLRMIKRGHTAENDKHFELRLTTYLQ